MSGVRPVTLSTEGEMGKKRDTYKYHLKIGHRIKHRGITDDLERREREHRRKWPKGHIMQVGRRLTEEAAREWKERGGKG